LGEEKEQLVQYVRVFSGTLQPDKALNGLVHLWKAQQILACLDKALNGLVHQGKLRQILVSLDKGLMYKVKHAEKAAVAVAENGV
jgi:hypothetical protein